MTNQQKDRMSYLVKTLNDACQHYYDDTEQNLTMTDSKYDELIHELINLEEKTRKQLPNTPTLRVGYATSGSDKIKHCCPILSLKDTKSIDELLHFLNQHSGIISWKLDGISIVLHYRDGKLVNAATRGDGETGQNITNNAIKMRDIPLQIASHGDLFVRGEGCLAIKEFEKIHQTKLGEKYANPRSAAAGIINTLTAPSILLKHMSFVAYSIVSIDSSIKMECYDEQLSYLKSLGFNVVYHQKVLNFELKHTISEFTNNVQNYEYPVDGLVLRLNSLKYGSSLGATAKHNKHSLAFKWPDEKKLSKVVGMRWSVSGTGLITPVVLIEPISLEGTIVKQANLHNLKFFEQLSIGKGDILNVYKANKIVPEIDDNLTRSGTEAYPTTCPVCGSETVVFNNGKTKKLYCYNCAKTIREKNTAYNEENSVK